MKEDRANEAVQRKARRKAPPPEPRTLRRLTPDRLGAEQQAIYWPDPLRGPWRVEVRWAEVEGRAVPVGIEVASYEVEDGEWRTPRAGQSAEVTRDLFKRLPVASLIEQSRQAAQGWADFTAEAENVPPEQGTQAADYADALTASTKRRQGRPRDHGPEFYAQVARLYVEAVRGGGEPARKPARYVQDALVLAGLLPDYSSAGEGLQHAQAAQVRKYVQTARRDGLIPSPTATKETKK